MHYIQYVHFEEAHPLVDTYNPIYVCMHIHFQLSLCFCIPDAWSVERVKRMTNHMRLLVGGWGKLKVYVHSYVSKFKQLPMNSIVHNASSFHFLVPLSLHSLPLHTISLSLRSIPGLTVPSSGSAHSRPHPSLSVVLPQLSTSRMGN